MYMRTHACMCRVPSPFYEEKEWTPQTLKEMEMARNQFVSKHEANYLHSNVIQKIKDWIPYNAIPSVRTACTWVPSRCEAHSEACLLDDA